MEFGLTIDRCTAPSRALVLLSRRGVGWHGRLVASASASDADQIVEPLALKSVRDILACYFVLFRAHPPSLPPSLLGAGMFTCPSVHRSGLLSRFPVSTSVSPAPSGDRWLMADGDFIGDYVVV